MKNIIVTFGILLLLICICACGKDEPTSSCTDGILNGSETGIDCGGDCGDCELSILAIYDGSLKVTRDNDPTSILYQSNDVQLAVETCDNNCLEFTFITDAGSTQAVGSFEKNQGFYLLDIDPVYEFQNNPQTWEIDWPQGSGTFNYIDDEMIVTLKVDDSHSVGSTDSFYSFEG